VPVRIRRADAGDTVAIATVYVRSWQGAYPSLIPQSYLDALRPEDRVATVRQSLDETAWPRRGTFVLLGPSDDGEDGPITGFVSIGPSRDEDVDADVVGEILTIYLDPDVFGTGGGSLLLYGALDELRRGGFTVATLWVLGTNARARRFYERHGLRPDGTTKLHDWGAFVATDHRYVIDLT